MTKEYGLPCPVARTLDIIGDRWTLLIVRDLLASGTRKYAELAESLKGIAPNILADRLRTLEEHGIVEHDGDDGIRCEIDRGQDAVGRGVYESGLCRAGLPGIFVVREGDREVGRGVRVATLERQLDDGDRLERGGVVAVEARSVADPQRPVDGRP